MIGPRYFPEALAEYEEAIAYYERHEEGLGVRLHQELEEAIALAMEFPEAVLHARRRPGYWLARLKP